MIPSGVLVGVDELHASVTCDLRNQHPEAGVACTPKVWKGERSPLHPLWVKGGKAGTCMGSLTEQVSSRGVLVPHTRNGVF